MCVSQKLIAAIKLGRMPAYKVAWAAGINPSTLSKLINGIEKPRPNDRRIIAVGQVLGIPPEECFQNEPQTKENQMKSTCQACGAPIKWIVTKTGKKMPVDLKARRFYVITNGVPVMMSGHEPHWATCSDPNRFKKKKAIDLT